MMPTIQQFWTSLVAEGSNAWNTARHVACTLVQTDPSASFGTWRTNVGAPLATCVVNAFHIAHFRALSAWDPLVALTFTEMAT